MGFTTGPAQSQLQATSEIEPAKKKQFPTVIGLQTQLSNLFVLFFAAGKEEFSEVLFFFECFLLCPTSATFDDGQGEFSREKHSCHPLFKSLFGQEFHFFPFRIQPARLLDPGPAAK